MVFLVIGSFVATFVVAILWATRRPKVEHHTH